MFSLPYKNVWLTTGGDGAIGSSGVISYKKESVSRGHCKKLPENSESQSECTRFGYGLRMIKL